MIVQLLKGQYLDFIGERTGMHFTPAAVALAALDDSGRIHGMVAFDNWKRNCVDVHLRLNDWGATRALWWPAFYHPMIERGRAWMRAEVISSNARSIALVKRLGFRELTRIPNGWEAGDDLIVFVLHRDECRWLDRKARVAA